MSNLPNFPTIRPSLLLDFANGKQVDPRITFTRSSTATYFDAQGVLRTAASGVPRIDHDPVTGECKGLIPEEARTNLLTYSEQFDNAAWGKSAASVSANMATAPDGSVGADKLVEDTGAATHYVYASASSTTNTNAYTASIYVKAAERSLVNLFVVEGATFARIAQCTFNLATGVAGSMTLGGGATGSATIQSVGGGWYRCSVTATLGGTETSIQLRVRLADAGGNTSYTGNGTSGLYIWGAQLEAGAFPTSYIPTTSAAATRAAAAPSMSGTNFSEWYRQGEGAFVVFARRDSLSAGRLITLSDGTASNQIRINVVVSSTSLRADLEVVTGGVSQASTTTTPVFAVGSMVAIAFAYKADDFAISVNGTTVVTDTSGTVPTVDRVHIGTDHAAANHYNGTVARIAYYPKRLTNAELQAITA